MKTVNTKARWIMRTTYCVPLPLEKWQGKYDLLVMTLNDFDVILGLDFLKKAKIILMSYLGGILIVSETCLIFVPCYKTLVVESKKGRSNMISTIAIIKALKKSSEVFLAIAISEDSGHSMQVSNVISKVLEEYEDVISPDLPKKLPPRRVVDHRIDLVLGGHYCRNPHIVCLLEILMN